MKQGKLLLFLPLFFLFICLGWFFFFRTTAVPPEKISLETNSPSPSSPSKPIFYSTLLGLEITYPDYLFSQEVSGQNGYYLYLQNFPYKAPPPENAFQLIVYRSFLQPETKPEIDLKNHKQISVFKTKNGKSIYVFLWKINRENEKLARDILASFRLD